MDIGKRTVLSQRVGTVHGWLTDENNRPIRKPESMERAEIRKPLHRENYMYLQADESAPYIKAK